MNEKCPICGTEFFMSWCSKCKQSNKNIQDYLEMVEYWKQQNLKYGCMCVCLFACVPISILIWWLTN